MSFHATLRALRESAGLSRPELADKSGVSVAGLADLEQGRNQPRFGSVVKLAAALGLCVEAFVESAAKHRKSGRARGPSARKPLNRPARARIRKQNDK